MIRAIIDLGTNTFNLLIAEVSERDFKLLYNSREAVMLGMGGINEGFISDDAMERAIDAIGRFAITASEFDVDEIVCFGTSALRGARNAKDLVEQSKSLYGIDVNIISGEEEANLIYKGTKLVYPFEDEGVIMDIGGGSTEFIKANKAGVQHMLSLNIGVSRIYQQLGKPKEFSDLQMNQVFKFVEDEVGTLMHSFKSDVLVGSSGSFETLYELIYESDFTSESSVHQLPMEELIPLLEKVIKSTYEERLNNPWISPVRKTMLPIAAAKVLWIIKHLDVQKVYVSPFSLKEGALFHGI